MRLKDLAAESFITAFSRSRSGGMVLVAVLAVATGFCSAVFVLQANNATLWDQMIAAKLKSDILYLVPENSDLEFYENDAVIYGGFESSTVKKLQSLLGNQWQVNVYNQIHTVRTRVGGKEVMARVALVMNPDSVGLPAQSPGENFVVLGGSLAPYAGKEELSIIVPVWDAEDQVIKVLPIAKALDASLLEVFDFGASDPVLVLPMESDLGRKIVSRPGMANSIFSRYSNMIVRSQGDIIADMEAINELIDGSNFKASLYVKEYEVMYKSLPGLLRLLWVLSASGILLSFACAYLMFRIGLNKRKARYALYRVLGMSKIQLTILNLLLNVVYALSVLVLGFAVFCGVAFFLDAVLNINSILNPFDKRMLLGYSLNDYLSVAVLLCAGFFAAFSLHLAFAGDRGLASELRDARRVGVR